ncbi:hypothetical protein [Parvicella tangerina]|uniref:Outer membrane protein beta-barrel domain-containing protein n=1 Tax=Parvicella tangerina TaxID=2829795 RepID=A0A916JP59_9FLAO|nr:hypothetical protein [Parvicella tangerina]CAG5084019.1 hypothetical protein CRYO30217_02354 [Parvicella tangerina]
MRGFIVFGLLLATIVNGISQEGNTVLNRPLKNINYMSVNTRLGYGIGKPSMNSDNNWTVRASVISYFGLGYNFVIKNNWGFDAQINQEIGKFTYGNEGPEFQSGYSTTGVEIGVKKSLYKKSDDTFFIRAAFGYNFLVIANDNNTSLNADGEIIYTYSTSSNASNMYVLPELCYQFRFPSGNHILDFSVGYKYALSDVATVDMTFLDSGNLNEQNSSNLTGRFIGASVRYSFLFKGFEKNDPTKRKVDNHF